MFEHNCNDDVDNEATDHPAIAKCLCFFGVQLDSMMLGTMFMVMLVFVAAI